MNTKEILKQIESPEIELKRINHRLFKHQHAFIKQEKVDTDTRYEGDVLRQLVDEAIIMRLKKKKNGK